MGYYPSFTWRSIISGQNLLIEGTKWIVRNGRTTRLWDDAWVPDFPKLTRPPSLSSLVQDMATVNDLFNSDGTGWDYPLIYEAFPIEVARKISSIHINPGGDQEDCIRWLHSKDGSFSVKSGYWVAKNLKDVSSSKTSSSSNSSDQWKWIWQLRLPPKFRYFAWKCMRGILPSKSNLCKRGISIDPICSKCGQAEETLEHVLRDCSWTSFFWQASVLRLQSSPQSHLISLEKWILDFVQGHTTEVVEVFVSHLWTIWKARNLQIFQQKMLSHLECFRLALTMLMEYRMANAKTPEQIDGVVASTQWNPPSPGWVRFNSDASLGSDGKAGFGGVFNNCEGTALKFTSDHISSCFDVECAEGLAILSGLQIALVDGFMSLEVESDCHSLISALNRGMIPRTSVGTIIADIQGLAKQFDRISFRWIRRDQNLIAHQIANHARSVNFNLDSLVPNLVPSRRSTNGVTVLPH